LKKVREFLNSMFAVLSTGQQFRAALARTPAEALTDRRLVVFDEYTSVVDRTVAQTCSYALQKTVRRHKLQCIAVTCHDDVIDWLQPDWTYEPAENRFAWRLLRCRPSIPLHIVRCTTSAWPLFAPHHYLSGHINRSSVCFLASWQDRPVAFSAWLPFVGQGPLTRREHRTVVLPDYQGVGVGMAVSALIASMWKALGYRAISTTTHPAFTAARQRSPAWRMTRAPALTGADGNPRMKHAVTRLTASFTYTGPAMDVTQARLLHA
jgi:GNAT superfamily N-acetyltransferase